LDEANTFYLDPPEQEDQYKAYCVRQAHSTMITYASLNALERASLILSEGRADGQLGEDIGLPLKAGDLTFSYEQEVVRASTECLDSSFDGARELMEKAREVAREALRPTVTECERLFPKE